MLSSVSLGAIHFYQRHLSPRKGYSCALRLKDGTAIGCSGYAKHRIQEVGLIRAIPYIRARFKACRQAADEHSGNSRRRRSRKERDCGCFDGIACCDFGIDLRFCASHRGGRGKDNCDLPDCGDCGDCGGPCT